MSDEPEKQSPESPDAPRPAKKPVKRGRFGFKKKEKKTYDSMTGYLWHEWIKPLGLIFIIMGTFRLTLVDWFDVPTGSMEPTIMAGDRIVVNKSAFGLRVPFTKDKWILHWGTPHRGEIVVCYSPDQGDEVRLVKRIVAEPGDTIEMRDGRLYINDQAPEYAELDHHGFEYIDPVVASKHEFFTETIDGFGHPVMLETGRPQSIRNFPKTTVPDGMYVMIGDNRDHSKDSRAWNMTPDQWGTRIDFMPGERIQGRAFAVAFSLDHWKPRWGRFFQKIH